MENEKKHFGFLKTKEEKAAIKAKNQEILAAWKEEKRAKKQAKKDARALRKARKKARPFWQKLLRFCITAVVIVALALVSFAPAIKGLVLLFQPQLMDMYQHAGYREPDMEFERNLIPADTQAQEAIQAMTGYDKDDTWAIYLYIVGADLESHHQNDLSEMTILTSSQAKQDQRAADREATLAGLNTYIDTVAAAGLELPSPMYYADPPAAASSTPVTNNVIVSPVQGAASMDLDEIFKVALPENINIVIRTGGAAHWSNPVINPNRVQTFLYSSKGFNEECSKPAYCMSTTEALTDFLNYCRDNHDADHKVLILWDHGAGAFGYGQDELYGKTLSVKEIGAALAASSKADVKDPPYELIGFDACLMASAEVMDILDGYGRYFAGSEEVEPGFGWNYTGFLNELVENPGMNGAQLGLAIADSYMDFYARMSNNFLDQIGFTLGKTDDITFSVLDIHKGAAVMDAYEALMEETLALSAKDDSVLTAVSQAVKSAIHYAERSYAIYNTVDIGTFMDNMPQVLAGPAARVQAALEDAVLYTRSSDSLKGSRGLSVYFPDITVKVDSIAMLMKYINTVSDNEALNTLYFYKAAGCLTEEMQAFLAEKGLDEWKPLDLEALRAVAAVPVELGSEGSFSVPVAKEAQARMTGVGLVVGKVEEDTIVYYGASADAELTEQGVLTTGFDGKWISLKGQPLSVEVVFDGAEAITYHSPIMLGIEEATLVFSFNKSSGEYTVLGAYKEDDAITGDLIGRNISDLTIGDTITPVYATSDTRDGSSSTRQGDGILWDGSAEISLESLPNGSYLSMITFGSIRGDEFNTGIVEMKIQGGRVTGMAANDEYAVIYGN